MHALIQKKCMEPEELDLRKFDLTWSAILRERTFRNCFLTAEVGTTSNRFSEHFLIQNPYGTLKEWHMVEPYPNDVFWKRFHSWKDRGIGRSTKITHHQTKSTNTTFLESIPDCSLDFIYYLDGAHDYTNVKAELPRYWRKVKKYVVLAGHDYADHGEISALPCAGCWNIPKSEPYTEYGVSSGKHPGIAVSQAGVVRAVQEWMTTLLPHFHLHHTFENFTRASLAQDGFDYDLVITGTRNPSWYVIKV